MYYDKIERLSLTFFQGTYDWLNFRVSVGDQSIRTRFWAHCDPLPKLKHWLEAICIGVEECAFSFDAEGDELKFVYDRNGWRQSIFRIGYPYSSNQKWLLEGPVDHIQLVREFYIGFLNHRNSPLFNRDGWETEYLWERLVRKLTVAREHLIDALLPLTREELDALWFVAAPDDLPAITIDFERFGVEDPNVEFEEYETDLSEHLVIPLDYDERSIDIKRDIIERNLDRKWNGRDGTRLIELRSAIIEDFLEANADADPILDSHTIEGSI